VAKRGDNPSAVGSDDLLEEIGGDITDPRVAEAVDQWWNELDADLAGKVDNYAALITSLKARATVRAEEADRLDRKARTDRNSADFLATRLKLVMEHRNLKKVECRRYTVSIAKAGGKPPLLIDDGEVPETFKFTPQPVIDKERIRQTLDKGESLPFARYGERGTYLRIS
jgi:hypothetical protein